MQTASTSVERPRTSLWARRRMCGARHRGVSRASPVSPRAHAKTHGTGFATPRGTPTAWTQRAHTSRRGYETATVQWTVPVVVLHAPEHAGISRTLSSSALRSHEYENASKGDIRQRRTFVAVRLGRNHLHRRGLHLGRGWHLAPTRQRTASGRQALANPHATLRIFTTSGLGASAAQRHLGAPSAYMYEVRYGAARFGWQRSRSPERSEWISRIPGYFQRALDPVQWRSGGARVRTNATCQAGAYRAHACFNR